MTLVSRRRSLLRSIWSSLALLGLLYPSSVQSVDTVSLLTCQERNVAGVEECDALCLEGGGLRSLFGGLSDFGVFCQCGGDGACSDYPIMKCSDRGVTDEASCTNYCDNEIGFLPMAYSATGSKSDCACGQFEFCTDTFFPDEPAGSGDGNETTGGGGGPTGGPTNVTTDVPSCADLDVLPGTTTDNCRSLCGDALHSASDTNILPPNESAEDQKIYRLTNCTCDDELKCEDKLVIVDLATTELCEDIGVTNSATCADRCHPQGYEFEFADGAFICRCQVGLENFEVCAQDPPSVGSMIVGPRSVSWLVTALAVPTGILHMFL